MSDNEQMDFEEKPRKLKRLKRKAPVDLDLGEETKPQEEEDKPPGKIAMFKRREKAPKALDNFIVDDNYQSGDSVKPKKKTKKKKIDDLKWEKAFDSDEEQRAKEMAEKESKAADAELRHNLRKRDKPAKKQVLIQEGYIKSTNKLVGQVED